MKKIRYALLTTVESNMKSFVLPLVQNLDKDIFEPVMICAMSDKFVETYSDEYRCIPIDIKRGFHLLNLMKTIIDLKNIFKREQFDIVQYGTENAAFCASIAAWYSGIPIRIYEHWGARYVGYTGFMRRVSIFIEKTAARFSTHVRQVSNQNMEMCVDDGLYKREKVKVLGKGGTVGVDFEKFDLSMKKEYCNEIRAKYGIPKDAFLLGYVGRIQRDKGINELLGAFKSFVFTNKDIRLMLVGSIDDANPVTTELMHWAQNSEKVVFTGQVGDVYKYMSSFDMLVHPTYREGFGMVLQEAAAIKVPIITTNIMGPGEFIIDGVTGALVPSHDERALREKIEDLLTDKEKAIRYAEEGYRYTKEFFERSVMVNRIIEDRLDLLSAAGYVLG